MSAAQSLDTPIDCALSDGRKLGLHGANRSYVVMNSVEWARNPVGRETSFASSVEDFGQFDTKPGDGVLPIKDIAS